MGSSNPLRKFGVPAMEDTRGEKTQIFYNEDTDQIVHVAIDDEDTDQIVHVAIDDDGHFKVTIIDIYGRVKYDYDVNKDLIYKGRHKDFDADGSESDWKVTKYTYDIDVDLIDKQTQEGIWNSRTGLGW